MWSLLREISFRHLKHSPIRTGLVIFGIALGVSMLSAVLSANASLLAAFKDMVDRVAGKADLTVAAGSSGIPNTLTSEIAAIDGVAHAAAMVEVMTRTTDGGSGTLLVLGVDFLGDTFFLPFAQPGEHQVVSDPLAFVNDAHAVLISKKLAKTRKLSVGSPLPLLTPDGEQMFYVRGLLEDEGPAASFGGQVVVMFLDALQVTFGRGELVDRIDVALEEGADPDAVRERIRALVKGSADVEAPSGRSSRLVTTLWAFRNGLNASGLAALWVGMFLIYNAVSISVAQRRREVGILRALGVTRQGVTALFCLEALVMAVFGSALGLIFGGALAELALADAAAAQLKVITTVAMRMPPPRLTPMIALGAVAAGLGTTVFAAYFPARKSAQIDPAEALRATRSSAMLRALPSPKLALFGSAVSALAFVPAYLGGEFNGYLASVAVVCGLALFVPLCVRLLRWALLRGTELSLGIPGRLALDNVERSLGRSAVTVIAMMLAVSMSMTIGAYGRAFERSLLEWAEQTFSADAIVSSGSPMRQHQHVPFSPAALEKLRGVEGLAHVNPSRGSAQDFRGRRFQLNSSDVQVALEELHRRGRHPRVLEGPRELDARALTEAPRVTISENLARATGLGQGDLLPLNTPTGARKFEIYAVVVDYSSDKGTVFMDRKWYVEFFRDAQIDTLELYFASGASADAVIAQVRQRLGSSGPVFVTLEDGIRELLTQIAANVVALSRAPELVTLVVALLGVIGTMLAAVIDRIRELGMLRAIGATRRQIVSSVVTEAGFLGLAATACGIAAGVPQGYLFLKVIGVATSGWNLPYAFPYSTALRVGCAMIAAAAFAGLLPAVRASRLDVRDALSYE